MYLYLYHTASYYNFGPFLYKSLENAFFDGILEQQGVDIEEMISNRGI